MVANPSERERTLALRQTMRELANLPDGDAAAKKFGERHPKWNKRWELGWYRDKLRELWRGGPRANTLATEILLASQAEYRPREEKDYEIYPVEVDWQRGELTYIGLSDFQDGVFALLKVSRLLKVCARPGCPTPHFIARRIGQAYCERECADIAERERKLEWWKEHGDEWRHKRARKSKRKRGH